MINKPDALVFFDLDGTLLTSQVEVAESSIQAIQKLKDNNIEPILATGRTYCEVEHIMKASGINSIVAMNGQAVVYEGDVVFLNNIEKELIEKITLFSDLNGGIPLAYYSHNMMRISKNNESAQKFYAYLKQAIPPVDPNSYKTELIQMLLLLCESGEDAYRDEFPELTFIRNTPYCVDVFKKGGSKAFGIQKLIENKHFEGVPTYAFGDGLNDLEMFEFVDHPIAMGNASEPLKKIAEYVTDDNDHDGILKGLEKSNLI